MATKKLAAWKVRENAARKGALTRLKNQNAKLQEKVHILQEAICHFEMEGCPDCGHSPDIMDTFIEHEREEDEDEDDPQGGQQEFDRDIHQRRK